MTYLNFSAGCNPGCHYTTNNVQDLTAEELWKVNNCTWTTDSL